MRAGLDYLPYRVIVRHQLLPPLVLREIGRVLLLLLVTPPPAVAHTA